MSRIRTEGSLLFEEEAARVLKTIESRGEMQDLLEADTLEKSLTCLHRAGCFNPSSTLYWQVLFQSDAYAEEYAEPPHKYHYDIEVSGTIRVVLDCPIDDTDDYELDPYDIEDLEVDGNSLVKKVPVEVPPTSPQRALDQLSLFQNDNPTTS